MTCLTRDTRLALALVLPLAAASGCTMNNPLFEVTAAGADSSGEGSASTSATSVAVTTTGPDATSTPTTTQGTSVSSSTTVDPGTGTTLEPGTTGGITGVCGDGFLDPGELCDDGNLVDGDGCTSDCSLLSCGNGVLDGVEQCDDGNQINEDACLNTCVNATCGDGYLLPESLEACDDGMNGDQDDGCTDLCLVPECGDGFVQASIGEQCDDGQENSDTGLCKLDCTKAVCGDGMLAPGETCDDGNDVNSDTCTTKCEPPKCGDGFLQGNEQCDDENLEDNDACKNNCTKNPCGDGFVDLKTEECDWAAENFKNAPGVCSKTCKVNFCVKMTNTANTDIADLNWFDPCIDADGTKVHVLVFDSNKQLTYIGSGTKNGDWQYEKITSIVAPGDQWKLVMNHQPIMLSPKSDRLFITARSSVPNLPGCPSSLGDGYGVTILPMAGDAPKLVFMPTMGKSGGPRNFKNWSASHELSYGSLGMNMCGELGPTPLIGSTVYFAVTD